MRPAAAGRLPCRRPSLAHHCAGHARDGDPASRRPRAGGRRHRRRPQLLPPGPQRRPARRPDRIGAHGDPAGVCLRVRPRPGARAPSGRRDSLRRPVRGVDAGRRPDRRRRSGTVRERAARSPLRALPAPGGRRLLRVTRRAAPAGGARRRRHRSLRARRLPRHAHLRGAPGRPRPDGRPRLLQHQGAARRGPRWQRRDDPAARDRRPAEPQRPRQLRPQVRPTPFRSDPDREARPELGRPREAAGRNGARPRDRARDSAESQARGLPLGTRFRPRRSSLRPARDRASRLDHLREPRQLRAGHAARPSQPVRRGPGPRRRAGDVSLRRLGRQRRVHVRARPGARGQLSGHASDRDRGRRHVDLPVTAGRLLQGAGVGRPARPERRRRRPERLLPAACLPEERGAGRRPRAPPGPRRLRRRRPVDRLPHRLRRPGRPGRRNVGGHAAVGGDDRPDRPGPPAARTPRGRFRQPRPLLDGGERGDAARAPVPRRHRRQQPGLRRDLRLGLRDRLGKHGRGGLDRAWQLYIKGGGG